MFARCLFLVCLGRGVSAAPRADCADPDAAGDLRCSSAEQLQPVGDNYWRRWQQATTNVMSGRRASPLYRDASARMDAYWRIAAHDRERPWMSDDDAAEARDLAWVGATMGLERMLRETFERSDSLGVLYRLGSTFSGANIEIRGGGPGGARVRYNAQAAELRASQAAIDDDTISTRSGKGTIVRSGMALQLVDADDDEEVVDPELAFTIYTDLRRIGLDAVRLSFSERVPQPRTKKSSEPEATGRWGLTLKQGVAPAVDLFSRIEGKEAQGWRPSRTNGGVSVRLPTEQSWTVRTELIRRFPYQGDDSDDDVAGEWRAMVRLKANLRWNLPQPWDGWPLGKVPGSVGRNQPEVPGTLYD